MQDPHRHIGLSRIEDAVNALMPRPRETLRG
jgi:hypothetical protein